MAQLGFEPWTSGLEDQEIHRYATAMPPLCQATMRVSKCQRDIIY